MTAHGLRIDVAESELSCAGKKRKGEAAPEPPKKATRPAGEPSPKQAGPTRVKLILNPDTVPGTETL